MFNNSSNITASFANSTAVYEDTDSILTNGFTQAFMSFFFALPGALANYFIFSVLSYCSMDLNESSLVLLRSQLFFDGSANLFILFAQFKVSLENRDPFAYYFICILFREAIPFWASNVISAYNIVGVAAQRCIISVFPFMNFTKKHSYIILGIVVLATVYQMLICYSIELEINYPQNICRYRYESEDVIYLWGFQYYIIPVILIILFYLKSIHSLRSRGGIKKHTSKKSENLMLKNAIVIATMYILLCGPNTFAYMLVFYDIIPLDFYLSFFRLFTWICTLLNSVSTPVVYLIMLKNVRKKCLEVLFSRFMPNRVGHSQTSTTD